MAIRKLPTKKVRARLNVQFQKGEGADQRFRALKNLAENRSVVKFLLRGAITETLLESYQRRFQAASGIMASQELVSGRLKRENRVRDARRAQQLELHASLVRAYMAARTLDPAAAKSIQVKMDVLARHLSKEVQHQAKRKGQGFAANVTYRGGKGRELMQAGMAQVLELIAGSASMKAHTLPNGGVTIGIGPIAKLEAVQTPSYTEYEHGRTVQSVYRVLWRQLEFGTGYYAKPTRNTEGYSKGKAGAWWYPSKDSGIYIRGSQGGHFLRDAAGLPYEPDSARFQGVFLTKLSNWLMGR